MNKFPDSKLTQEKIENLSNTYLLKDACSSLPRYIATLHPTLCTLVLLPQLTNVRLEQCIIVFLNEPEAKNCHLFLTLLKGSTNISNF